MINQKRLVKTLIDLIKIDSPSGEEEQIARTLTEKLTDLGCKVARDSYGNVIAKFPGEGEPFLLNAHMDTVEPGRKIKPIIEKDLMKSDGTTVLGGDPKAGVSIILEALNSIKESGEKTLPLEIIFTREEETTMGGSINLDYAQVTAKRGIIFDGDEHVHQIFISSPGYYSFDIKIKGRSAHAGVEPEKGLSAIEISSQLLSKLKLGRIDDETTMNIGLISGGSARNAVPELVEIKGEARSRDNKKLEKQISIIKNCLKKLQLQYPEAVIEDMFMKEFDGFKLNKDHKMVSHASKKLQEMGLTPNLIASGGASDANIFHNKGIEVVVVGTGVWQPHTTREYVVISQLVEAAKFCEKIISV